MASVLKLHPEDNVLIALRDLRKGEHVGIGEQSVTLASDVPSSGHLPCHLGVLPPHSVQV